MNEMDLDPLLLSRLQFVWVIAWHILLPALTVGLASYIAVLESEQQKPQLLEQEAEVIADGGEHGVDGVAA
jgi:hypothetical protein